MEIWGKSKAIHGTWFFLPEYNLLLDAGDGVSSTLGIHASDIEHVFISHTHLDHISGLLSLGRFQKRTLRNEPNRSFCRVLCGAGVMEKLNKVRKFLEEFGVSLEFMELKDGQEWEIRKNIWLRLFPVNHTADYYRNKLAAYGCQLIERRKRLKIAYLKEKDKVEAAHKNPSESARAVAAFMIDLKNKYGEDEISEYYDRILLSYCGDSEPVNPDKVRGSEVLMHEATFINRAEMEAAHSCFEDVLDMAKQAAVKNLIVYHLSERYKRELPQYKDIMESMAKSKNCGFNLRVVGVDDFFRAKI